SQTYECDSCSDCNTKIGNADAGDTVKLNTSISNQVGTCIDFNGKDNITFDCDGHTIDGDDTESDYGIYLDDTGDGSNNNTVNNCVITDFNEGFYIKSSSNNTLTNNTANSNGYGFLLSSSADNNTFTNNTANSNSNGGFFLSSSSNNTFTNNTANSNAGNGFYISGGDYNTLNSNTANSNNNGIYLYDSSDLNALLNNTISSNARGLRIELSSGNQLNDNLFEKNKEDVVDDSGSLYKDNQFIDNSVSSMITQTEISFSNRTPDVNDLVEFNISVYYPNGTACTSFTDNTYTRPSETINSDTSGENITGNFTVDENGLYSLVVNITDSDDNWVKRKYMFFVNASQTKTVNYYLRPDVDPTHGQPAGTDARALLFEAPTKPSNFTCSGWIQASPDNISSTPFGYLKEINISYWYNLTNPSLLSFIGIQRYVTYDAIVDENQSLPSPVEWTWNVSNFTKLNWSLDYLMDWYWLSIKLKGNIPSWYTNQTHPSYVNISYIYSDKPEIKELSNYDDVILLSATSPTSEEDNATIYLDGTGTTNLTVQMPNSVDYNASYDGINCDSTSDCNMSQSSGELEFALKLGSEHNITIWGSGDTIPPQFQDNSTNSTMAGSPIEFRINITDNVGVDCAIYSLDNGTGTFVNQSWDCSLSGAQTWFNRTFVVNETYGTLIRWRVFANDTSGNE
ncbi:MAG: DUF1565 domain-containing protein, partial [Candidatus Aenigmarchaeota archaeon]|nr:DUF1565 domain-containing protein [Candidatus Aenigmarchaeota archaeon]